MTTLGEQLRSYPVDGAAPREVERVIERGAQLQRRHRRRVAGAAVTISVAAALVIPVVAIQGHEPTSSSAAAFLTTVAHKAGAVTAPDVAAAPYWYSKSRVEYGSQTYTRQIWLGHNRSGRLIQPDGVIGETTLSAATFHIGAQIVTWDQLLDLPRNPSTLYRQIRSHVQSAGRDTDSEMFVAIGDLLRESPAPPALREALYEAAARIPQISLTPGMLDATGRAATGLSRTDTTGSTVTYLVDTATGALLEELDVNSDGTIGLRITYINSGVVNSTNAT